MSERFLPSSGIPPHTCRICGTVNDTATDPRGDAVPSPGDFTICLRCGHLTAFNADLTQRDLTLAEMTRMPAAVLREARAIESARDAVMRRHSG